MKFQVQIKKNGCASFLYFDASTEKEAMDMATVKIQEWLEKEYIRHESFPARLHPIKESLPATITVVEFENHKTKPKGLKLKFSRMHVTVGYVGGGRHTDYWYAPV